MSRHRGSLCLLPCVCHRRPHRLARFYQCSLEGLGVKGLKCRGEGIRVQGSGVGV